MMKVWYKLDDKEPDKVRVETDADVADLKKAIKAECPNKLKDVDALELKVFAAGADPNKDDHLPPGKKVEDLDPTTDENPLIVTAPPQQQAVSGVVVLVFF